MSPRDLTIPPSYNADLFDGAIGVSGAWLGVAYRAIDRQTARLEGLNGTVFGFIPLQATVLPAASFQVKSASTAFNRTATEVYDMWDANFELYAPLQLPDNALILGFELDVRDEGKAYTGVHGHLIAETSFDGQVEKLTTASSTNLTQEGRWQVQGTPANHTVDNFNEMLFVEISGFGNTSFHGARIIYATL